MLPLVDQFLPAHNLASLEQLARVLAQSPPRRPPPRPPGLADITTLWN
jgi:hypothetical protein